MQHLLHAPLAAPNLTPEPEPWRQEALCAETDPEIFFPRKGDSAAPAKKVCAACPVITECLTWALNNEIREGIFGGTAPKERQRILKAIA